MVNTEWLNLGILALWLKVVLNHKYDSQLKKYTVLKDESEQTKLARYKRLVDNIEDGAAPFLDAAVGYGQDRPTVVKQKMDQIERMMPRLREFNKRWPRGLSTVPSGFETQLVV